MHVKLSHLPLLCALVASTTTWANVATQTSASVASATQATLTQTQAVQHAVEQQLGKQQVVENRWSEWGLTETDWTRYEELKKGPQGIWNPNLDPLTMLGIEARSESERTRYAELLAKKEFERNEKILAFQLAYDAAFTRLYPNILPFRTDEDGQASTAPSSPNRIIYFTRTDCNTDCTNDLKKLLAFAGNNPVDIYLVDSQQSDDKIRKWALEQNINIEKVRSRQITLNHDKGMWLKNANGKMPVAFRIVGEEWQRVGY